MTGRTPSRRSRTAVSEDLVEELRLLRAANGSALEPWALVQAVRDPEGRVVDFVYRDINLIAARQQARRREDLLGRSLAATLPNVMTSGLFGMYARCADTGEPLVHNDFSYHGKTLPDATSDPATPQSRRYEVRGVRVEADCVSLTWRDVTDRLREAERVAQAELEYRLIAENVGDVLARFRDGRIAWISPSVEKAFGAPPGFWVGRTAASLIAEEDLAVFAEILDAAASPDPPPRRLRIYAADGAPHWVEVHATSFYDAEGNPDGRVATLHLVDSQVRVQQEAEEARQSRQRADARYRDLIENSIVATALLTPEGRYAMVNRAMCDWLGYDADTLLTKTWQEITVPRHHQVAGVSVREAAAAGDVAELKRAADLLSGRMPSYQGEAQFIRADGHLVWGHLSTFGLRDNNGDLEYLVGQIVDITDRIEAQRATERYRRLMENSNVGMGLNSTDGRFTDVNRAMCDMFGLDAESLLSKSWQDLTPERYLEADLRKAEEMLAGRLDTYRVTKEFIHADGHLFWADVSASCIRKPGGEVENFVAQIIDVSERIEHEESIERYQRIIDTSPVAVAIHRPDGSLSSVNQAMCDMFGLDAEIALQMTVPDLTPDSNLQGNLATMDALLAGRIDSLRDVQRFIHTDGHPFWADVSVSCLRDSSGHAQFIYSQMLDVTDRIEAQQRLQSELDSAADYLTSILPGELAAPVQVSSRFLPSRELGGDCFDYAWIDDDHLMVYLLDVSGHGVQPALVAVSVLDMLRSGSLPVETLLAPERVLAELNQRFDMDGHHGHYLTIWYGVYHKSTRMLTYSGAGHPPALALNAAQPTLLGGQSPPVGMFGDTVFSSDTYRVPAGCQILLYSDGAYELPLAGGGRLGLEEFTDLCAQLAAAPPRSLDWLLDRLRTLGATGFVDDCSLIRLSFN